MNKSGEEKLMAMFERQTKSKMMESIRKSIGVWDKILLVLTGVLIVGFFWLFRYILRYAFAVIIPLRERGYIGLFSVLVAGSIVGFVLLVVAIKLLINRVTGAIKERTIFRIINSSMGKSRITSSNNDFISVVLYDKFIENLVVGVYILVVGFCFMTEILLAQLFLGELQIISLAQFCIMVGLMVCGYFINKSMYYRKLLYLEKELSLTYSWSIESVKIKELNVAKTLISYWEKSNNGEGSKRKKVLMLINSLMLLIYIVYFSVSLILIKERVLSVLFACEYIVLMAAMFVIYMFMVANNKRVSSLVPLCKWIKARTENESQYYEETNARNEFTFENVLEVRNLCYEYQENIVFENLSFSLKAGESLAITGENATGKSTLVGVLSRVKEIQKGTIYFDNNEIRTISQNSFSDKVAIILQDDGLINGSIYENLCLGKDIEEERIQYALSIVGLSEYIESLPHKLNTEYSINSIEFGDGIMQKLILARALINDASLYVLDDIFIGVDRRSRVAFLKELLKRKASFIIVSNDKSVVEVCDNVLRLR